MKRLFTTLIALLLVQSVFACSASFGWYQNPSSSSALNVTFYNTSSYGGSGAKAYAVWLDFGDYTSSGTFSSATSSTSHAYSTPGTYHTMLTVFTYDSTTSSYCADSVRDTITISYPPCATTIATISGAGGTDTFTTNTPAGTAGMSYTWNFGDGTASTSGSSVSHTYTYNGTYSLVLIAYSSTGGCLDSVFKSVTITSGTVTCSSLHAAFTSSMSGLSGTFYNTSTSSVYSRRSFWNFGDGTTATTYVGSHTYASAGSYNVTLKNQWYDSASGTTRCEDSITHIVSATTPVSISGYIIRDSGVVPYDTAIYKVWLITYDTLTHIIAAVDSQVIVTMFYSTPYHFSGVPAGSYLLKAYITNGPTSGSGYLPTYHDSSVYWSGAQFISYSTGATITGVNIWMQHGIVSSGPGFVAGNVLYGAGKTTGGSTVGAPVVGLEIMLRDTKNRIVASTYTNAAGDYKISNIPYGTYSIYPEALGYSTIAWSSINVTSGTPGVNSIDFRQNSTSIKPGTTAVTNVAAAEQKILVYPNPTSGKVTIQWDANMSKTANILVTNITGQQVYSTQLNIDGVDRSEVNLSQLQTGLYFMNIESGNTHFTQKVSIQH